MAIYVVLACGSRLADLTRHLQTQFWGVGLSSKGAGEVSSFHSTLACVIAGPPS